MNRAQKENINTKQYWEKEYSRRITRGNFKINRGLIVKIRQNIQSDERIKTVLDIGCGVGTFVKDCLDKKYKARGIDISEQSIRFAKNLYGKDNFRIADITTLKLKQNSIDCITSLEVIEHMEEPVEIINKLIEAAKYKVIISVPMGNSIKSREHVWTFEPKDFEDLGFEVIIFNSARMIAIYNKQVTTLVKDEDIAKYQNKIYE